MTDSRDMSPGPAGGDGATGLGWSTRGGRALIVCTGNVCRSPYMERRLARALAGTGVEVVSAGTSALTCEGIDPGSVERLRKVGASVDHFTATQLTGQAVAQADLVLTASREHRGQVVQLHPKALRYCFTWADFADLVDGLDAAGLGVPARVRHGPPMWLPSPRRAVGLFRPAQKKKRTSWTPMVGGLRSST